MKNARYLNSPGEVLAWIEASLQHPIAQSNFARGGLFRQCAQRFARISHFVFDASNQSEHAHFSTWWGGILERKYDNKLIGDLYLLHEMAHIAHLSFVQGVGFETWTRKMTDNELTASVISEIAIYLEEPDLRDESFPQEIFADRFLAKKTWTKRWHEDPTDTLRILSAIRRDAMEREPRTQKNGKPEDIPAFWVNRFAAQNAAWHAIWSFRYNDVESLLEKVEAKARSNFKAAAHLLREGIGRHSTRGIPWEEEAIAFDAIYRFNRKLYDKSVAAKESL